MAEQQRAAAAAVGKSAGGRAGLIAAALLGLGCLLVRPTLPLRSSALRGSRSGSTPRRQLRSSARGDSSATESFVTLLRGFGRAPLPPARWQQAPEAVAARAVQRPLAQCSGHSIGGVQPECLEYADENNFTAAIELLALGSSRWTGKTGYGKLALESAQHIASTFHAGSEDRLRYPIVIVCDAETIAEIHGSELYYDWKSLHPRGPELILHKVAIVVPPNATQWVDAVWPKCNAWPSYKHMIQWRTLQRWTDPLFRRFTYLWQMDTNLKPLTWPCDPFRVMAAARRLAGYWNHFYTAHCEMGGVETALDYAEKNGLKFRNLERMPPMGGASFVFDIRFWTSGSWLDFARYISDSGIVYRYRTDEQLHYSNGLALLVSTGDVHQFGGWRWRHFPWGGDAMFSNQDNPLGHYDGIDPFCADAASRELNGTAATPYPVLLRRYRSQLHYQMNRKERVVRDWFVSKKVYTLAEVGTPVPPVYSTYSGPPKGHRKTRR